jgi:hypothetical protein
MNAPRFTTSMASALKLPGTGDAADIRNGGRATEGRDMNRFFHILRDPLFLFLLIGGGFFLAYTLLSHRADRIEVTQAMQASLAADYEAVAGHKPDAAEQAKLVQEYVANELLFREAIARGMHLTDKATKQRLTDRLRFMLTGTPNEPTEADLIDYYATHLGSYRAEPQISFEHVFFANPPADPAGILARLNRGEQVSGDEFWMGRSFPDYGQSMVRGMFGQAFLSLAEKATPGSWFGPVRSNRGMHFVRVSGRRPAGMMPYTDIREQVRQDFIAAKTSGVIDAEVAKLERKYDVAIDR